MPTLEELQNRIAKADKLLAGNLPPADRLKVAKLRLLDEIGVMLRRKRPDLDDALLKARREKDKAG